MSGAAIETGHGMMPAYVATPRRSGPHPGVVIIHDAMGMGQDVRNQADWLAGAGFLAVARARMAVLEHAGARLTVERLRLEWRPGTDLPDPDPRLAFRPAEDTDELLDLMTRTLRDTLDAHSRADLARMSAVDVRHRAGFAYVSGELPDGTILPLCRLRYGGYANR